MNRQHYLSLAAIGLLFLTATPVQAALTAAGQVVTNQATVDYQVNSVSQTQVLSDGDTGTAGIQTTSFTVDFKVDLSVADAITTYVDALPGSSTNYLKFTVTNSSNKILDFSLAASDTATDPYSGTENFDAAYAVYVDANGNGTYESGTDTATAIDDLGIGSSISVFVVGTMPGAQANGSIAAVDLTATALNSDGSAIAAQAGSNTNAEDIVYADGAGSNDAARDKQHSDSGAFRITSATLTVTKSVAVANVGLGEPYNSFAIPGAVMTYSIIISNTGGQTATGITLVDQIPANTSFYVTSGPSGGDGSGTQYEYSNQTPFVPAAPTWTETPAADGNGVDTDVTAIKIKAPNIAAAGSVTVTFKVKID